MTHRTLLIPTRPGLFGGSITWMGQLQQGLASRGWRVVIAVAGEDFGGRCEWIPMASKTDTSEGRRRAIVRLIRESRADVVVPHHLTDAFPAVLRAKSVNPSLRLVTCSHEISPELLADIRMFSGVVDGAVGVSALLAKVLEGPVGLGQDRVWRIPCGVEFPEGRTDVGGQGSDVLRLGFAGRLEDDKRVLDLVGFCRDLEGKIPYRLDVVGSGSRLADLEHGLSTEIQAGRVKIFGYRSFAELHESIYPEWDAFLLFSPLEGVPVAVMEGMAHGAAPIVSDFRGRAAEGLLRHGETALVFPVGDVRLAAAHAVSLHENRRLWERLSAAAREAIASGYTAEAMIGAWAEMLATVVEKPQRRDPVPDFRPGPAGRLDAVFGRALGETVRSWIIRGKNRSPWLMASYHDPMALRTMEDQIQSIDLSFRQREEERLKAS